MATSATSMVVDAAGPVHVTDLGGPPDGPVVLCVHGLRSWSGCWSGFAEAARGTHRVLAVDLPGHGRSPAAGRSAGVHAAGDVLATLLPRLGPGPVTLVGHSMGAVAALLAAAAAPDEVDRLLLVSPPLPGRGLRVPRLRVLPYVGLCLCPRLGMPVLRRVSSRAGADDWPRTARPECNPAEPLESFLEAARSVGLLVAGRRRYRELLEAVAVPARVVHGTDDRVVDAAGIGLLHELRPDWPVHLLRGVGHSPHVEAPATIARLVGEPPVVPAAARAAGRASSTASRRGGDRWRPSTSGTRT
jgi:pimeloyl-ACP methyl ester carboxylesterase